MQKRALTARPAVCPRLCDRARPELRLVDRAEPAGRRQRSRLVLGHRGLVVAVANQFRQGGGVELDDLIQEGIIGLLRAADHYDPCQGSFATYARWWVRAYVRVAAKKGAAAARLASLDDASNPEGEHLFDCRVDLERELQRSETRGAVRVVLHGLRRRVGAVGQEVIERRLCSDSPETLEQLGRRWRLSRERIRQIEIRTKLLLQRHLREAWGESAVS